MATTTAAQAAAEAAQAAADIAFFRSLDLSENNKENLPPWLAEEREPIWARQRAAIANWRPTPEQERRYRARHPLPPERTVVTHDITFGYTPPSSTLPIIRPRRVRGEWHEIFLQEWERPVARDPPPAWASGAGRGNPVPQPFLNSPILDARGVLIDVTLRAAAIEAGQGQSNTPRPEIPDLTATERSVRGQRRRAPIPVSFSTPQLSTPRIAARSRPLSLSAPSGEERDSGFEIFEDPEERTDEVQIYEQHQTGHEEMQLPSLNSLTISDDNDVPEVGQSEETVEELAQTLSSIRIVVDEPNDDQGNQVIETVVPKPAAASTVLTTIYSRPRSSTYPGNKVQYTFLPFESILESLPGSPVKLAFPKPTPGANSPFGPTQDALLNPVGDASATSTNTPSILDFQEFKKSFPRRVRLALELPVTGNRRVRSLNAQPSPPFELENGFLEAMQA